jgi:hypothetical protein
VQLENGRAPPRGSRPFLHHASRRDPRFYQPKTKVGARSILAAPELLSEMKVWKLACPPNERNLVFPSESGKPAHRKNVSRKIPLSRLLVGRGVFQPEALDRAYLVRATLAPGRVISMASPTGSCTSARPATA